MTVEDFICDDKDQSVSWSFNGKAIRGKFENVHFADIDTQNSYVYVEAGPNHSQDQVYYLSFDGKIIFSYDKISNKIRWQQKDKQVEMECKNILHARFYIEDNAIIVISGTNQLDERMLGYSLDGRLLFNKEPPQGHIFRYLSSSNNHPAVVCDGGEIQADAYGRTSWHFVIDRKTGDMIKGSLAY